MPPNDPTYTFGNTNEGPSDPADDYVVVGPSATPLAGGICKAILCDSDGVVKLTNARGTVRDNISLVKGYNPLRASTIDTATVGSVPTKIIALY